MQLVLGSKCYRIPRELMFLILQLKGERIGCDHIILTCALVIARHHSVSRMIRGSQPPNSVYAHPHFMKL